MFFSVITFSLVDRFTSYSHTMLLWSRPLHWYATLWPSNGRVCIVLRNIHLCWKIRRKIWKSGFNAWSTFPSCLLLYWYVNNQEVYCCNDTNWLWCIFAEWAKCYVLNLKAIKNIISNTVHEFVKNVRRGYIGIALSVRQYFWAQLLLNSSW